MDDKGKNRILTLQVEIVDKKDAWWIWDSHVDGAVCNGIRVQAIMEGPIPEVEDELD